MSGPGWPRPRRCRSVLCGAGPWGSIWGSPHRRGRIPAVSSGRSNVGVGRVSDRPAAGLVLPSRAAPTRIIPSGRPRNRLASPRELGGVMRAARRRLGIAAPPRCTKGRSRRAGSARRPGSGRLGSKVAGGPTRSGGNTRRADSPPSPPPGSASARSPPRNLRTRTRRGSSRFLARRRRVPGSRSTRRMPSVSTSLRRLLVLENPGVDLVSVPLVVLERDLDRACLLIEPVSRSLDVSEAPVDSDDFPNVGTA